MTLTLPETLLLFALHDDRGTVHSVAYIGLDHALRGALVAELKLRGHVQVKASGDIRFHPQPPPPPPEPLLRDTLALLASARNPAPVSNWLETIGSAMPDLRARVLGALEVRRIVAPLSRGRGSIPPVPPRPDEERPDRATRRELLAGLDDREQISPRLGILTAFIVAVHLDLVVFESRREEAEQLAAWVSDRDSIVRAVISTIRRAEGDW